MSSIRGKVGISSQNNQSNSLCIAGKFITDLIKTENQRAINGSIVVFCSSRIDKNIHESSSDFFTHWRIEKGSPESGK